MKRVTSINLILGIWLIASPFALGHATNTAVTTNDVIFGILLLACSTWILADMANQIGVNWFQVLCCIWLIVSPFVLQHQQLPRATANDVTVGVIALAVGLIEAWALTYTPIKA